MLNRLFAQVIVSGILIVGLGLAIKDSDFRHDYARMAPVGFKALVDISKKD